MHPTFPNLPGPLSRYFLSKFHPRSVKSPERFLIILSCQIDELLPDLSVKTDENQPLLHKVLSHLPGGLGHFADSNSIPWRLTTTFHPVLTVAMLLTYLPLLAGRLFQRCHLSRIDEVLKCGDSMIKLHMLSHTPSSCLYIQLSVLATAPRILTNFIPSRMKSLSCTDKIEYTE